MAREAKKTTKVDIKYKDIVFKDGELVEFDTGEIINLMGDLAALYGEDPFTVSATNKIEEIVPVGDEAEEAEEE